MGLPRTIPDKCREKDLNQGPPDEDFYKLSLPLLNGHPRVSTMSFSFVLEKAMMDKSQKL